MSDDTLRIVRQPGNLLLSVSHMIEQDAASQLFRATVVATTDNTVRIQRTGHDPDAAEYAVLDSFPYPVVGDEVLVARVGSGWIVIGHTLRSGLTANYLRIDTDLSIFPGGHLFWDLDGSDVPRAQLRDEGIQFQLQDETGLNRDALQWVPLLDDDLSDFPNGELVTELVAAVAGRIDGTYQVQHAAGFQARVALSSTPTGPGVTAELSAEHTSHGAPGVVRVTASTNNMTIRLSGQIVSTRTDVTIDAGGAIDVGAFTSFDVDTFGGAATDNLDTLSNGVEGAWAFLRANDSTRTVVVRDGVGNIQLAGGVNFSLDHVNDIIGLYFTGSVWIEMFRSNNG